LFYVKLNCKHTSNPRVGGSKTPPADEDFENMKHSRPRLIEWLHMEDYGIKVARENRIPMEVIEAYAFPPIVKY
jgi:hypothetical protein